MHSMLLRSGDLYWGGWREKSWPGLFVRKSVCLFVCPSILTSGGQTAGQIGTGVAPFNAPERRNDDGAGHVTTRVTWHVPRTQK